MASIFSVETLYVAVAVTQGTAAYVFAREAREEGPRALAGVVMFLAGVLASVLGNTCKLADAGLAMTLVSTFALVALPTIVAAAAGAVMRERDERRTDGSLPSARAVTLPPARPHSAQCVRMRSYTSWHVRQRMWISSLNETSAPQVGADLSAVVAPTPAARRRVWRAAVRTPEARGIGLARRLAHGAVPRPGHVPRPRCGARRTGIVKPKQTLLIVLVLGAMGADDCESTTATDAAQHLAATQPHTEGVYSCIATRKPSDSGACGSSDHLTVWSCAHEPSGDRYTCSDDNGSLSCIKGAP